MKALVIDDNRQMADGLAKMLTLLDLEVTTAYGSREGMITLQKNTPEVIFLDINMPGVSGFEVMSFIRREPRLIDVPVIVVSSENQPETLAKAKDAGVTDFVLKPATIESLEAALQKL